MLANAVFLKQFAFVLELLPYNWEWNGISQMHRNLTATTAEVQHVAWRATRPVRLALSTYPRSGPLYIVVDDPLHALQEQCVYNNPRDAGRFRNWHAEDCTRPHCLIVHLQAGLLIDLMVVETMLRSIVDLVEQKSQSWRDASNLREHVAQLLPWPEPYNALPTDSHMDANDALF